MKTAVLALVVFLALPATAAEPQTSNPEAVIAPLLGPRPEIADYPQREQFIREVLAWEKRKTELSEKLARGELKLPEQDENGDWHHVTGPEDLDTALRNAHGYQQPDYPQTYRFNRTTHLSFPLKRLPSEQLATKRVEARVPQTAAEMDALVQELADSATNLEKLPAAQAPGTISAPSIIRSQVESTLR